MTEYDRGAYTPQYDEELAFDPRHPRGKRPLPLTLIASAAVLVVLVGAVALAYRSGVRSPGEAPHTVGKPVLSVKSAPGPDAQAQDDTMNLDVYDAQTQARAPAPATQPAPEAATPASNTMGAETAASAPVPAAVPAGPPPAFAPPPEEPVLRPHPKVIRAAPTARAHAEADDEPATGNMTPTADGGWKLTAKTVAKPAAKTAEHAKSVKAAASESPRTAAAKAEPGTAKAAKAPTAGTAKVTKLAANETKSAVATRTAEADDEGDAENVAPAKKTTAKTAVKSTAATNKASGKTSLESKATVAKTATNEGETADAKPVSAAHGKFMVQIGAFASSALADKGYAAVAGVLPGQMSGKGKHVEPVEHNGKALYRTTVTGFASRADAVSFCEALKAKGKICFVKG